MELLPHLAQSLEAKKVLLRIADVGSSALLLRLKREMNADFQPSVSTLNSWMRNLLGLSRTSISSDSLDSIQLNLVHRIQNF